MNGRDKCELLNEVRQKIAEKNNIEFTVYECTFEGDCTGTCPKCESEVRYLEEELAKKQARGEKINLEGIFTLEETCPTWIDTPRTNRRPYDSPIKDGDMYIPEDRTLGIIIPDPIDSLMDELQELEEEIQKLYKEIELADDPKIKEEIEKQIEKLLKKQNEIKIEIKRLHETVELGNMPPDDDEE